MKNNLHPDQLTSSKIGTIVFKLIYAQCTYKLIEASRPADVILIYMALWSNTGSGLQSSQSLCSSHT